MGPVQATGSHDQDIAGLHGGGLKLVLIKRGTEVLIGQLAWREESVDRLRDEFESRGVLTTGGKRNPAGEHIEERVGRRFIGAEGCEVEGQSAILMP